MSPSGTIVRGAAGILRSASPRGAIQSTHPDERTYGGLSTNPIVGGKLKSAKLDADFTADFSTESKAEPHTRTYAEQVQEGSIDRSR